MPPEVSEESKLLMPDEATVEAIIRKVAEEEILSRYQSLQDHEVGDKHSGEIVTAADIESERRLSQDLLDLFPGSTFVGEEGFASDPKVIERFDGNAPVWVLDPLDGTRNFSEGRAYFCVIVALVHRQVTQAGWIYDPLNEIMYSARVGEGVRKNTTSLAAHPPKSIGDMNGSVGRVRREKIAQQYGDDGPDRPAKLVRYRCIGMEYVDLVKGNLDFAEYGNLKPWDHAAGILLLKEAGGHGAYADTLQEYVPGPIERSRYVATRAAKSWPEINRFLSV